MNVYVAYKLEDLDRSVPDAEVLGVSKDIDGAVDACTQAFAVMVSECEMMELFLDDINRPGLSSLEGKISEHDAVFFFRKELANSRYYEMYSEGTGKIAFSIVCKRLIEKEKEKKNGKH